MFAEEFLACMPSHRSVEPGSLMVRIGLDDRAEGLTADPDVFYVTEHYVGYTAVLVRMSRATPDEIGV
jgi:hypothetical protein